MSIPAKCGSKVGRVVPNVPWCETPLGEILPLKYGKARTAEYGYSRPGTSTFGSSGAFGPFDRALTEKPAIIVGRKGAAGSVHYSAEPCWPIDTAFFTEGTERTFLPFFRYLLESLQLVRLDRSTAIPSLSRDDYDAKVVRYPKELEEQRRIVAEIEKQFTRLDAGIAALRRTQANLKRYRAAVLKAACEGRLVPTEAELAQGKPRVLGSFPTDDFDSPSPGSNPPSKRGSISRKAREEGSTPVGRPKELRGSNPLGSTSYETGEQLLARIFTERRKSWSGRGKYREPSVSDTHDLPSLPGGWTWAPFGFLGADPNNTVQTGPFGAQLHNSEFTSSGVPVIAVGNLTGTGFRTHGLYFVDEAKAKHLARYDVWAGDLLFARSGATLGKVCVAPPEVQDWRMTGHILRARLNQQFINPKIAVYALAALPAVRKQVFRNVRGVTRPGFNTGLLESILIPIPPLAEQTRIVAEVERRLSVVEELEAVVSANLQRATRLRQSILQKAFAGGLV